MVAALHDDPLRRNPEESCAALSNRLILTHFSILLQNLKKGHRINQHHLESKNSQKNANGESIKCQCM